jgi:hypothetical protein
MIFLRIYAIAVLIAPCRRRTLPPDRAYLHLPPSNVKSEPSHDLRRGRRLRAFFLAMRKSIKDAAVFAACRRQTGARPFHAARRRLMREYINRHRRFRSAFAALLRPF